MSGGGGVSSNNTGSGIRSEYQKIRWKAAYTKEHAPEVTSRLDTIRAEQMKKIQQRKEKEHE